MYIRRVGRAGLGGVFAVCALGIAWAVDPEGSESQGGTAVVGGDVILSLIHGDALEGTASEDPSGTGDFISGFSIGTTSCNIGDVDLDWVPDYHGSNQHPVIRQGMYRLLDNRLEQIGTSWVKHGFFALNEEQNCSATCTRPEQGGYTLYVGCSDPYSAGLNASRPELGPTWEINAHTGFSPIYDHFAPGTGQIANRLQVHNYDLNPQPNAGATYFVEGHYVHPDDAATPRANNNASYADASITKVGARYFLSVPGFTRISDSAIRAWKDEDPSVFETDAQVPNEGLFILAAKVTNPGTGIYTYEYALQNLNSDRSGGTFTVPLPEGVSLSNIEFHDVDYHDADGVGCEGRCVGGVNHGRFCCANTECTGGACSPLQRHINFDGTDWAVTLNVDSITWATAPYATVRGCGFSQVCSNKRCFGSNAACTGSGQSTCVEGETCEYVPCDTIGGPACPQGEACVLQYDCTVAADCPDRECSETRASCDLDADCVDETCVSNVCSQSGSACELDVDCPARGQTCESDVCRNPNANALRWSTMYNFRFDANVGPDGRCSVTNTLCRIAANCPDEICIGNVCTESGSACQQNADCPNRGQSCDVSKETSVAVGLFKPGFPSEIAIRTVGPRLALIDCNLNTVADNCDVDCNGVGCEPPCGESDDCDENGVPDECQNNCIVREPPPDYPDSCEILLGIAEDCNANTVPDDCEDDCDDDGIIDDCETIIDCDRDGVNDCQDDCPCTTPAGACLPPYAQIVDCCFSNGFIYNLWTWSQCVSFCVTDPFPELCGPVCDDPPVCPGTICPETDCREGCLVGDGDGDGDFDLKDASMIAGCFSGASGSPAFIAPSANCLLWFDFEEDGDVDLSDYLSFVGPFPGGYWGP